MISVWLSQSFRDAVEQLAREFGYVTMEAEPEDWNALLAAIDNPPEPNDKLRSLLK